MIVLRLLRFLRGYVWFECRGVFVERFLNLVARSRIPVWSGSKRGEVYTGCVLAKDYPGLREHAKKTGVRLRVVRKRGAPFQRYKYRRRTGLLIGLGVFLAFVLGMGQFIWRVEVNGNELLNDMELHAALEQLGVRPGVLRASIDVRDCERKALLLLPELSWCAINITGSAVRFEVNESTPPPEMIDPKAPCNLVAREAGQILSMNIFNGQIIVNKGDTVLPGDIIVSGITQDQRGQSLFRHARGEVIAQVQTELEVVVPLNQTEYRETGKTRTRLYLGIFNWEIPLFLPIGIPSPYHVEREETTLSVLSAELPFWTLREEYFLMEEHPITYTEEQAKLMAMRELALLQEIRLGGAKILDKTITGKLTEDSFTILARYTCTMDIALEKEIAISE